MSKFKITYPKYLNPEQRFLRLMYVAVCASAKPAGKQLKWIVTGNAAILGLLIANIGTVSTAMYPGNLRWGIIILVVSLLIGIVSLALAVAVTSSVEVVDALYNELESNSSEVMLDSVTTPPEQMNEQMYAAFVGPLKWFMRRSVNRKKGDLLGGEKESVRWLCWFVYAAAIQNVLAAIGIIILAWGIK
jgi:hypothetical protein